MDEFRFSLIDSTDAERQKGIETGLWILQNFLFPHLIREDTRASSQWQQYTYGFHVKLRVLLYVW